MGSRILFSLLILSLFLFGTTLGFISSLLFTAVGERSIATDLEEEPKYQDEQSSLRLLFLGDTMMDGNVAKVMLEQGDSYPLHQWASLFQDVDFIIANLETAVGTSRSLEQKEYAFQTHPDRFQLFQPYRDKLLFTLANNHGMDAPLKETMQYLDELGYNYVGVGNNQSEAYQPFVFEKDGLRLGIIGASRVIPFTRWVAGANSPGMASAYTDQPLLGVVEEWSKQVDYLIVFMHWGEERVTKPNAVQLGLEKKLREHGADIVIGSHPHVLQGIEWKGAKDLTAFSLGNFVFTTSFNQLANDTLALEVKLNAEEIEEIHLHPVRIRYGLIDRLERGEDFERIIQQIRDLSPGLQVDQTGQITNY